MAVASEHAHGGLRRGLIGRFASKRGRRWVSARVETQARARSGCLLATVPMLVLAHTWDPLITACLASGWFVGAAGIGFLRARRWQRSRPLEDEPDAVCNGDLLREPPLALPALPLLLGLPVAVSVLATRHGSPSWVMACLWLAAVAVASFGYNFATTVTLSGFERKAGALVVRRRVRLRRRRRLAMAAGEAGPRYRQRMIAAGVLGLGVVAVAATAWIASNGPSVPERFRRAGARTQIVPSLSNVASTLDARAITVRCFSPADWSRVEREYGQSLSGLAGDEIDLSPGTCDQLLAFMAGGLHPSRRYLGSRWRLTFAIQTIAHESVHMMGIANEATTECYGMQYFVRTAAIMGGDPSYARALAREYWNDLYPEDTAEYRSSECRRGGSLDLRLSGDWP